MIRKAAMAVVLIGMMFAVVSCSDNGTGSSDSTLPSVELLTPWDGTTRDGDVTVHADASDNVGIKQVEFFVNGNLVNTDTSTPYEFVYDMSAVTDGTTARFMARAIDVNGNEKDSAVAMVTRGDSPAPTVSITSPSASPVVQVMQGDLVVLQATATDNGVPLAAYQVVWSSDLQGTLKSGATVNYRGFVIGSHTITVTATDIDGNVATATVPLVVTENDKDYAYIQEGSYKIGPPVFGERTVILQRPLLVSKRELGLGDFMDASSSDIQTLVQKNDNNFKSDFTGYPEGLLDNYEDYAEYPAIFVQAFAFMYTCQTMSDNDGYSHPYQWFDLNNVLLTDEYTQARKAAKAVIVPNTKGWRLPTEGEWEVLANGGLPKQYPWGTLAPAGRCNSMENVNPPDMLVFADGRGPSPVTAFSEFPNGYGLFNVAGNVAELCTDMFTSSLPSGSLVGYSPDKKVWQVVKGGAWYDFAGLLQIGVRMKQLPFVGGNVFLTPKDMVDSGVGARLVRNLDIGEAPW